MGLYLGGEKDSGMEKQYIKKKHGLMGDLAGVVWR